MVSQRVCFQASDGEIMDVKSLTSVVFILACVVLVACGGNSDDGAGSPETFRVIPPSSTLTTPRNGSATPPETLTGFCNAGPFGSFLVVGGVAPYNLTILNSTLVANKSVVSNRNDTFTVSSVGTGCFTNLIMDVQDALDHHFQVTFTSKEVLL